MNVKQRTCVVFAAIVILFLVGSAASASDLGHATARAMKTLDAAKDDPSLLVLTNAPYVQVDGACALPYLADVQAATGCAVGRGNLLFFQRPQNHPLRIMLFKKTTGDAVIISRHKAQWASEPDRKSTR